MQSFSLSVRVLAAAVPLLLGCAQGEAFQPLNRPALRASKPQTLLIRNWPPPRFDGSAVKMILPLDAFLIQAAMAGSMGSVDREGIHDPATTMRIDIGKAMAKRFSIEVVDSANGETTAPAGNWHAEGDRLAADLVLDIRTTDWGVVPTRFRHYGAKYTGTLTLTDLRSGKILARSNCDGYPVDNPENPTFDELQTAGPHRLKAMIRTAAEYCYQDYRKRVLGLL
jgi:hypothetical protein